MSSAPVRVDSLLPTTKYDTQNIFLRSFLSQINAHLPELVDKGQEPEEIDVVLSGGGFKGFFLVGAWSVFRGLIEQEKIIVKRWAGTSVGAGCAVYMCCGLDPVIWCNTYWRSRRLIRGGGLSINEAFAVLSNDVLPENAHEICTGRVFLSITLLTAFGPKNMIISKFYSNSDLIEAVNASCSIPYITSKNIVSYFRGMRVIDGGFTNNTPVFVDSPRRQLVVHTPRVHYASNLVLNMKDPCVDSLVINGAFLTRQFFNGDYAPEEGSIFEWLESEPQADHKVEQWYRRVKRGVHSFSPSALFQFSGIPTSELFSLTAEKPIKGDQSAWQRVSKEVKYTLLHYRLAIIILTLCTILMATPVKWENTEAWKRLFTKLAFWRVARTGARSIR